MDPGELTQQEVKILKLEDKIVNLKSEFAQYKADTETLFRERNARYLKKTAGLEAKLKRAIEFAEAFKDQQAMPDDSLNPAFEAFLKEIQNGK